MKKEFQLLNTFFAAFCALFVYKTTFAEPVNLDQLKNQVIAYHDSGNYQKEISEVVQRAEHFIIQRAEANAKEKHPKKLAVVLDIDETSLTTYKNMLARNFCYNRKQVYKEHFAADAPAIKPMLSLYNDALKHGISVFFITGRRVSEQEPTVLNLKTQGYNNWAGLYFKPEDYTSPSNIPFKSSTRAAITKQGYTIIASIGDQNCDLKGGYAEKTFKLPNPYYFLP